MAGPCIQECFRIVRGNAAAQLKAARIRPKCQKRLLLRCLIIGGGCRIQQNDVAAFQTVFFIKIGIVGAVHLGHKIFRRLIAPVA